MSSKSIAKAAASSLILGTAFFGVMPIGQQFEEAQAAAPSQAAQTEARLAKSVKASMLKGKTDRAVASAEQLVALSPNNPAWRQLLGETYLSAGRFQSAATSFNDALTLNPANGQAALKLALSLTAMGDVGNARSLLEGHKANLAPADYGLAVALSGDAQSAIQTLESAVRGGAIDARTRQNLALSYALAGRWVEARITAAQDVSPDMLDQRMTEWASLARPRTAWDQVAGVLGVKARLDRGQPTQLALNTNSQQPVQVAQANEMPVVASEPVAEPAQVAAAEPQPQPVFEAQPDYAAPVASASPRIVMAPRREVVQQIPERYVERQSAPIIKAERRPAKQPVKTALAPKSRIERAVATAPSERPANDRFVSEQPTARKAQSLMAEQKPISTAKLANGKSFKGGEFAVQLGAFANATIAKSSWNSFAAKVPELSGHRPMTSRANVNGKSYTRLASAGFATKSEAEKACSKVRAAGQDCFIRTVPAQELAQWVGLESGAKQAPVKLARRDAPVPTKPAKISAARPKAPVRTEVKIASR